MNILDKLKINHRPSAGALDPLKYIGPGLLVTVGFIDPGTGLPIWLPAPNSVMPCSGLSHFLPSC